MKNLLLSFIVSLGIFISALGQSQELPDSTVRQLKFIVDGFKNRYQSPSMVVAIVHDKKIIFSEALGYTDIANKIPATVDSKYPLLSVTKPFTATMLMHLRQRNMLTLEDDVKKYLPEFKGSFYIPGKSGTTLFQLATHTSGLPRNTQADISFTKQIDRWVLANTKRAAIEPSTKKEFLSSLKFIRTEYPRYEFMRYGDRHYSNLGYSMLGIALERAAKTDYATYIIENICKPLKMNSSGFLTDNIFYDKLAKGYYYNDSTKSFIESPVFKPNSALYAGGMYSTATDLAKFISFQFDNSVAANKILSDDNKAMMQAFNIGWRPSYPFVMHEGSMLGYRCVIAFNTELKIGWVVLTNTTDFDFSRLNDNISKLVLPVYTKQPRAGLDRFTGTYRLAGGYDSLEIYVRNDSLYSTYLQDVLLHAPLTPVGNNRFRGQGKGSYNIGYDFIPGDNTEIKYLNMGQLMWIKQ